MTDLGLFEFASAPRTGTSWLLHAAAVSGLATGSKATVHQLFEEKQSGKYRISLIRHPCSWLASYFTVIHPGFVGVPSVDAFRRFPVYDFDNFIRRYLKESPGAVGRMFLGYQANSYLRMEDFALNFVELLAAYEVPWMLRKKCLTIPPQNQSNKRLPDWNPSLWDQVVKAERDLIEAFDYGRNQS